jgi:tocopherol O-methyltransferase
VIRPNQRLQRGSVAQHYDELDSFYREIWGEHVHHGFWQWGDEEPEQATAQLIDHVAQRLQLQQGDTICDIGCGYGGTARYLTHQYGARVTALTISPEQYAYARSLDPAAEQPRYVLEDWLHNNLPAASFEGAVAIESTEHMPDLARAIAEAYRVLKPGGRLVICAWLAHDQLRPWEVDLLLEPICREGQLYGMGTVDDYRRILEQQGFVVEQVEDVSQQVWRTWPICLKRIYHKLWLDPRYRRFLRNPAQEQRIFLATMVRIWAAYCTGAMRYGIFTGRK